jgi:hypothetical protein
VHWQMVTIEKDSAEVGRDKTQPLVSPRFEDLTSRAQDQVKAVHKIIQLACKADLVGGGKVRINASGYAHHDETQMPTDQRDFVAISIGRTG